jgi:hypothetical protein
MISLTSMELIIKLTLQEIMEWCKGCYNDKLYRLKYSGFGILSVLLAKVERAAPLEQYGTSPTANRIKTVLSDIRSMGPQHSHKTNVSSLLFEDFISVKEAVKC